MVRRTAACESERANAPSSNELRAWKLMIEYLVAESKEARPFTAYLLSMARESLIERELPEPSRHRD